MEIDDSGWHDLDERLGRMQLAPEHRDVLLEHVLDRLVGHFGVDTVEVHLGKDDPRRHAMREVAAAALAHLGPVLDHVPAHVIAALVEEGKLGTAMPPPWDDHWRTDPRTASWRS